jgi:hypothetical protein
LALRLAASVSGPVCEHLERGALRAGWIALRYRLARLAATPHHRYQPQGSQRRLERILDIRPLAAGMRPFFGTLDSGAWSNRVERRVGLRAWITWW